MTRKTAAALLLLVTAFMAGAAPAHASCAEQPGVTAALKWPASLSTQPRAVLALSFEVMNTGGNTVEVVEHIVLPDGWSLVTRPATLTLAPGQSRIRLHSVAVPAHAAAGDYDLLFELLDSIDASTRARVCLTVPVASVAALTVATVSLPAHVVAGSCYVARFLLTNAGNGAAAVSLDTTEQEGFTLSHVRRLQLEAGESRVVDVTVSTSAWMREAVMHRWSLVATAGEATARAWAEVEVIPASSGEARILLPVQARATLGIEAAARPGAFNVTLTGKGYVDEDEERELAFCLGMDSDNYVNYRSPLVEVALGSTPFSLSALTGSLGSSALSFGVGVAPVRRDRLRLETNFVTSKLGSIAGTELRLGLAPGCTVSMEAAVGGSAGSIGPAGAARAEIEAHLGAIGARGRLAIATAHPGFPGRYGNRVVVEGSAELPAWGRLSARGQVTGVLAHGDGKDWEWRLGGRVNLHYAPGGDAWLCYRHDDDQFAVGITQRLGSTTLDARYHWRPDEPGDDALRVSLDLSSQGRPDYQAYYSASGMSGGEAVHTVGAAVSMQTGRRLCATLDASRIFGAAGQSTSIGARLHYSLSDWLRLEGEAKATRPDGGEWGVVGKVGLTATQGFSVPVGVRTSVGTLAGRVFDASGGLGGVVVRVGKLAAMTAADGTYQFSGLEPGVYYVQVDRANLPHGCIADLVMPAEVAIEAGATGRLDIPITRKASLSGQIVVCRQADPRGGDVDCTGSAVSPLTGVTVSATMGGEQRTVTTDAEGRFSLVELRPGSWEVRVVADGGQMPEGHVLEAEALIVSVEPGGKAEVLFKVVPRGRELQMLDGGSSELWGRL